MCLKDKTLCRKLAACLITTLIIICIGCTSNSDGQESFDIDVSSSELNILETSKRNLSIASPDTIRVVISLLSESDAGRSEAGIEYAYIASEFMSHVYPVIIGDRIEPNPPPGSIYPGLFETIESGNIPEIEQNDISFLTVLIASTVVLYTDDESIELDALDFINQAIKMNEKSVLPLYLRGFINERRGRWDEALNDYTKALELDPSTYPAEIGTARIFIQTGRNDASVEIMDMLAAQYPFSTEILTTAAEIHFRIKNYSRALEFSSEVLRAEPDNPDILLLRAEIFLEQNNLQQSRRLIEVLRRMNYSSPCFYLLKSRIEKIDGDDLSALNTLEHARKKYPENKEIEEAYGAVLMLTGRKDEAREILTGEDGNRDTGIEGLIVLIDDAIELKDWNAASEYAERLLQAYDSLDAGLAAWKAWYSQKNYQKALEISSSLYEKYDSSSESAIAYIRTLIVMNRRLQAKRILDKVILVEKEPEKRSELYYLKSLTDTSEEDKLQSLRSALFEDLQNVEALISISVLYTEMGDVRKAYRYIKQAAVIDPDNREIRRKIRELEGMLR